MRLMTEDPAGGKIRINSLTTDISDGQWIGRYFTDYPVELTAVPEAGYYFAGWIVADSDSLLEGKDLTLEVKPEGVSVTAVFKRMGE